MCAHTHIHTHSNTGKEYRRIHHRQEYTMTGHDLTQWHSVVTSRDKEQKIVHYTKWMVLLVVLFNGSFQSTKTERNLCYNDLRTKEDKTSKHYMLYSHSLLNRGAADKNHPAQLFLTLWVPLYGQSRFIPWEAAAQEVVTWRPSPLWSQTLLISRWPGLNSSASSAYLDRRHAHFLVKLKEPPPEGVGCRLASSHSL